MGFKKSIRRLNDRLSLSKSEKELQRIQAIPHFKVGDTHILGKPFKFHDGPSFVVTYREIFQEQLYRFNPVGSGKLILDCGANMGLSVVYFALNYPDHKILAFEPDESIYNILEENVHSFGLKNVELKKQAVWVRNEQLKFYTDYGMGSRANLGYKNQEPKFVNAVPLKDYLTTDVEFLKIDIEGAEEEVLNDCVDQLKNVKHLFFEYHNDVRRSQTLHQLLALIKECGFHYYIKESGARKSPFTDKELICETFDMAINIFCYKEESGK